MLLIVTCHLQASLFLSFPWPYFMSFRVCGLVRRALPREMSLFQWVQKCADSYFSLNLQVWFYSFLLVFHKRSPLPFGFFFAKRYLFFALAWRFCLSLSLASSEISLGWSFMCVFFTCTESGSQSSCPPSLIDTQYTEISFNYFTKVLSLSLELFYRIKFTGLFTKSLIFLFNNKKFRRKRNAEAKLFLLKNI